MIDIAALQETLSGVSLLPPTFGVVVAACLVALLLLASGLASGFEIAFFSLSPSDLNEMEPDHDDVDRSIELLREDSERTLATILITNNFVNVTIIMLCNYVFAHLVDFGDAYWLEFLCITVLLTFLLLLFGEIIPKIFARQSPLHFCRRSVRAFVFLRRFFWPLGTILLKSGVLTERFIRKDNNRTLSVDDLEQALELTDKEDIKNEQSMLRGIIRFGDETSKDVMTCRKDIVDLDINTPFEDVLKCIVDNNYSRIPVFKSNADNICGVLYIKDLLPHIGKTHNFRWQSLIRPPYFVPETKRLDALLREFQNNKVHIAIVVDEFGGTSGIVTLEDIMEEIVGEINDEYDDDEKNYVRLSHNNYIFEGKTLLTDFYEIMDIDDEYFDEVKGEADTIAGLILEVKGDFPKVKETITYRDFTFKVLNIEERRITRIEVRRKEQQVKEEKKG